MKTRWLKALLRWINLHPLWRSRRTQVWGGLLRAPTFDRWLALQLHRAGLMGTPGRRFLETHIKPGMTVVDIGANQGLYTLLFARLAGEQGAVLAFEPDDLLFAALEENLTFNHVGNAQTFHLALGSVRGTMTLFRSLLNSGDNRLTSKAANGGPREAVPVRIERLDEVLVNRRIDFIKMDVQGWEMEVFRGMQGVLDAAISTQMAIYFEYWPQGLRDAGSEPLEPLTFLTSQGFALYSSEESEAPATMLDPHELARSIPAHRHVNLYALRRGR